MDKFIISIYLDEIITQCNYAINAVQYINSALHSSEDSAQDSTTNFNEVHRNIHSFLTHVSNISRLLWPPKPIKEKQETNEHFKERKNRTMKRGEILRNILNLPTDGHILKNRLLRDHLEHYDERLDEWWEVSQNRTIVRNGIGGLDSYGGVAEKNIFRLYDPNTNLYLFRGERYDLQKLASAVEDLGQKVELYCESNSYYK